MKHEWFTEEWARAWQEQISESHAFRKAASNWEWPLVLVLQKEPLIGIPEDRGVYFDLFHGECRAWRLAAAEDFDNAAFVISSDAMTWKQVLDGELEPFFGLIRGKLKLVKGSMLTLAPYVVAARELVATAKLLDTKFPEAIVKMAAPRLPTFHG
jgi:Putative sterol carrier protein